MDLRLKAPCRLQPAQGTNCLLYTYRRRRYVAADAAQGVDIRIKAGIVRKVRPNRGPRAKRAGFQSRARSLVQRSNPTSAAALPLHQAVEALQPNGIARRPMIPQNGLCPPVAKYLQNHVVAEQAAQAKPGYQRGQTPCRAGVTKIERKLP